MVPWLELSTHFRGERSTRSAWEKRKAADLNASLDNIKELIATQDIILIISCTGGSIAIRAR